jgi:Na+/melibiose symporter-like transporter
MSAVERAAPKLGVTTQALYGLGFLGTSAKMQLAALTLFFYNQLVGLDAPVVSFAIFVALFVDAFWDPIVGQLSDNTRTRLGRRHPYIYAAALPAAACFALIFRPPLGWSDDSLFLYLLVLVIASRMFESLHEIPNAALLPELSNQYDERTVLGSWRFLFASVVGRALAAVLGYGVFLAGSKAQRFGQMNEAGYAPYALTIGLIALVTVVASALATQRFTPFMHQPQRRRRTMGEMAREIAVALSNRNFVALALSFLIFGVALGFVIGLLTYFYTYFWELDSRALLQLRLWEIPGGLVGVFLAPLAAKRMGKKRACLTVFFMAIFCTTVPLTLRLVGVMPPNASPWVLRILIIDTAATGALSTLGFVIVTSMLADVVEEVQLKTQQRSEGLLFAADSFVRKITTSFTALLPGLLLAFVHFPRQAQPGHVPQPVLNHLALIYLPIVTTLFLCSTSALLLYRIDRRQHEEHLVRLNEAAALAEAGDDQINPHLEPTVSPI